MPDSPETSLIESIPDLTELDKSEEILKAKIEAASLACKSLEVKDELTNVLANDALARARGLLKGLEEKRKERLSPIQGMIDEINCRFDDLKRPIKEAEIHLVEQILARRDAVNAAAKKEQERLQRLAERRAKRAEERGEEPIIPEVVAPLVPGAAKSIETDAGKVTIRIDWKAEIVDESKLPREYLIPDTVKINATVRASKGAVQIPGVRAYPEEVPVTRMK